MKKRGHSLLVCNCSRPHGTPLLIGFHNVLGEPNAEPYRELMKNGRDSDDRMRFSGYCPNCNQFADIRLNKRFGPMRNAITFEPIEELVELLSTYLNPMEHIAYLSPHLRIIPPGERLFHGHKTEYNLPSQSGLQSLHIDSAMKRLLAHLLLSNPNIPDALLPDWKTGGAEQDFDGWIDEIDFFNRWWHFARTGDSNVLPRGDKSEVYAQWRQKNCVILTECLKQNP